MILRTSICFVKIWTLGPRIYYQNTAKNTRNMESSLKHIILSYLRIYKIDLFSKFLKGTCTVFVVFLASHVYSVFYIKVVYTFISYFVKMRIGKWKIFHKNHLQKIGYEFHIYQKAWNGHVVTFLFSGKGIPIFFLSSRKGIIQY